MQANTKSRGSLRRIKTQIQNIHRHPLDNIELIKVDQNFQQALFIVSGPIASPYQGYWFRVTVSWSSDYPFIPPTFKFLDKIWNPYVCLQSNQICMDILKDKFFCPALTTSQCLLSIISLLGQSKITNPDGFANPIAAAQMMNNYPYFSQQARKYCVNHSYKRQQIYTNIDFGLPEDHEIKAEGDELKVIVEKQSKDPKMCKRHQKLQYAK